METTYIPYPLPSILPSIASFIGSGINGNKAAEGLARSQKAKIASFIGSGINGNLVTTKS